MSSIFGIRFHKFIVFIHQKNLHSCVLLKIINLFQNVLERTNKNDVHKKEGLNHHLELVHIMDQLRNCVYKVSTFHFQNTYNKLCHVTSSCL